MLVAPPGLLRRPVVTSFTTITQALRRTRTQQRNAEVETPLDLRAVHRPRTYGLHENRTPSVHVYDDPGRGRYCFGCGRGGSIYDPASLLWERPARGRDFIELRRERWSDVLPLSPVSNMTDSLEL